MCRSPSWFVLRFVSELLSVVRSLTRFILARYVDGKQFCKNISNGFGELQIVVGPQGVAIIHIPGAGPE